MIRSIVKWPDPVLLTSTTSIDLNNPPIDLQKLENDLIDTLLSENALGLADNQICVPYRAMAIRLNNDDIRVMYNPEILYVDSQLKNDGEGCLSYPGITLQFPRPASITVRWQDRHGYVRTMELFDMDARCALHEIDHLNGIFFKSKVSELRWQRANKNR